MARFCELTGKGPMKGSIIWRSGKPKKQGGIGTHVTAITKRRFLPNLQRVKALLPGGQVRYVRVAASALKRGLITKAPRRNWKKEESKKARPGPPKGWRVESLNRADDVLPGVTHRRFNVLWTAASPRV